MGEKDERERRRGDGVERRQHLPEARLVVGVFRPMDRHHAVAPRHERQALEDPRALRGQLPVAERGVVHDVAGQHRALPEPLLLEIGDRGRRGRQQQVRHVVGDEPVDLLRHLPVEAAEAGFDVREGDVELRRRQRGGEGGVRVAVRHDDIGAAAREDLFEAGLSLPCSVSLTPAQQDAVVRAIRGR